MQCLTLDVLERLSAGELTEEDTRRWLRHSATCAACRHLLQEQSANETLLTRVRRSLSSLPDQDEAGHATTTEVLPALVAAPGSRIGDYELLHKLGEGGMSVVWEARQVSPPRRVAVKLLHPSRTTHVARRRLEYEAELLARLDHPGIAHIYDAGTVELVDAPGAYLVMELVDGHPLLDHVRLTGMGRPARLELAAAICDAVEHAHQRGIIHRDLKPGNIFVTNTGRPKILDFGIARALDPEIHKGTLRTEVGHLVGTLEYMAPEQLRGSVRTVDTRCDVYALGVVLFELLTGRLPYDLRALPVTEAARRVEEQDPPRLGRVDPSLRGDLEVIVSKALAKDPTRRYASAGLLAEDLRRFLAHEPITARRDSAVYVLSKLARRHRVVALLIFGLVLLLGVATGVTFGLYHQSTRNAEQAQVAQRAAEREAHTAQQVTDFLINLFERPMPVELSDDPVTARELLDEGVRRLRTELRDEPEVRASLLDAVGRVYLKLAMPADALPLLEEALALRSNTFGEDALEPTDTRVSLATAHYRLAQFDTATRHAEAAIAAYRRHLGPDTPEVFDALTILAGIASARAQFDREGALYDELLSLAERGLSPDDLRYAAAMEAYGDHLLSAGAYSAARQRYLQALETRERAQGGQHPQTIAARHRLGMVAMRMGAHEQAGETYRDVLAAYTAIYPQNHPTIANVRGHLALTYHALGQLDQAAALQEEVLAQHRARMGTDHPGLIVPTINQAFTYSAANRLDLAEKYFRAGLTLVERHQPGHIRRAVCLKQLGGIRMRQERYGEAEAFLRDALAAEQVTRSAEGDDVYQDTSAILARALIRQGRYVEAQDVLADAYLRLRTVDFSACEGSVLTAQRMAEIETLASFVELFAALGLEEERSHFEALYAAHPLYDYREASRKH